MSRYRENAETATAAILRLISASGTVSARGITDIIEQTIDGVAREHERLELQRVSDNRASSNRTMMGHCPTVPGMYKIEAKVNSGKGDYQLGVYVK